VVVAGWKVPVDDNTGTPEQYNVNRLRAVDETAKGTSAQGAAAAGIDAGLL